MSHLVFMISLKGRERKKERKKKERKKERKKKKEKKKKVFTRFIARCSWRFRGAKRVISAELSRAIQGSFS